MKEPYSRKLRAIVFILAFCMIGLLVYSSLAGKDKFSLKELGNNAPAWVGSLMDKFTQGKEASPPANSLAEGVTRVTMLDVGQGDSVVIQTNGKAVLIDSGERGQEKIILDFLQKENITKLDIVIATHPHSDHMGAMAGVLKAVTVERIIMPNLPDRHIPTSRVFTDLLEVIKEKDLQITPARAGNTYLLGENITLSLLGPTEDYYENLNDFSVVSRLEVGETSFLFTGDIEEAAEYDLLYSHQELKSTVLQVGHHGSTTSTTEDFVMAVQPQIAIISCGIDNSYGHPHREIVERLQARDITVYRTDFDGHVSVETDGQAVTVTTEME